MTFYNFQFMKIEFDNVFFIFLQIRDMDFIMFNKDIFNIQPNNYCQSPGWKQNTGVTILFHVDEARTTKCRPLGTTRY